MKRFRIQIFALTSLMALVVGSFAVTTAAQEQADEKPAAAEQATKPALPADWVKSLKWRCIGPANMGGRITSIAVYEKDPCIWWVASASGGLVKTVNNGITFEHQFDHEATVSIGSVAVAQSDPNIVWVGTGEANPRNSVSWGNGVYKSIDGGKTWKHMGLDETFQTGAVVIHPTDPNIVYIAALGRLWGPNEARGLYKTTDGGETWEKILYIDDKTGVIDVKLKPDDPDTILAATYERQRDGFDTNDPAKKLGAGSGLHKSTDGGKTWSKITKGLPNGKLGRIGIDFYRTEPDTVFIVLESEKIAKEPENAPYLGVRGEDADVGAKLTEIIKDGPAEKAGLKKDDIVIALNDETVHSYDEFTRKMRKHVAGDEAKLEVSRKRKSVFVDVTFDKKPKPNGDGDNRRRRGGRGRGGRGARDPFSSGLGGQRENIHELQGPEGHEYGGVYKSTDAGDTWVRINSVNPRPMYYSEIRVDPSDDNHIFVLGTSLYRSKDGGKTFTADGGRGIHVDHHAMWVDPRDGRHIILGNDGGLFVTHDRMEKWDHHNHFAIGQFYDVGVGPRRNYRVYGGLQDNGSWGGPSRARQNGGPINEDWIRVGGGDGFIVRVDPDDADQVYFESQNGSMGRINFRTGERGFIRPRPQGAGRGGAGRGGPGAQARGGRGGPQRGERGGPGGAARERYRFNWKTPFILSSHNSEIHFSAGNYVFRSLNKGDDLKKISPEITRTKRGSATALAQSPLDSDVLYVGSDDGAFWATRDGGHKWTKVVDFPDDKAEEGDESEDEKANEESSDQRTRERAERSDRPGRRRGGDRPEGQRRRGGQGGSGRMAEMLKRLDVNEDGKIERDEVPERMQRMFDRMDANGDGVIDKDEIKKMSERRRRGPPGDDPPRRDDDPRRDIPASPMRVMLMSYTPATIDALATLMTQDATQKAPKANADDKESGLGEEHPSTLNSMISRAALYESQGRYDEAETLYVKTLEIQNRVLGNEHPSTLNSMSKLAALYESQSRHDEAETLYVKTLEVQKRVLGEEHPDTLNSVKNLAAFYDNQQSSATVKPEDDVISGEWSAQARAEGMAEGEGDFSITLKLAPDGSITGKTESRMGEGDITDGKFDPKTGRISFTSDSGAMWMSFTATVKDGVMTGDADINDGMFGFDFKAEMIKSAPTQARADVKTQESVRKSKYDWKPLTELLPGPRWVSSIEASRFEAGRVYATFDAHRSNDDEPYLFVSENYGKTWRSIRSNLPTSAGTTRVLREDIKNQNILYLGAEFSAWVSIDRGKSWTRLNSNLPTVAVHEFAIHPTAGELVAATHGRSLWILDVTPIRQMVADVIAAKAHLYKPKAAIYWRPKPRRGGDTRRYVGENPASGAHVYYSLKDKANSVKLKITDLAGETIRELESAGGAGLHHVTWDLRRTPEQRPNQAGARRFGGGGGFRGGRFGRRGGRLVPSGEYIASLTVDGQTFTQKLSVQTDPDYPDYRAWEVEEMELEYEALLQGLEAEEQGDLPEQPD